MKNDGCRRHLPGALLSSLNRKAPAASGEGDQRPRGHPRLMARSAWRNLRAIMMMCSRTPPGQKRICEAPDLSAFESGTSHSSGMAKKTKTNRKMSKTRTRSTRAQPLLGRADHVRKGKKALVAKRPSAAKKDLAASRSWSPRRHWPPRRWPPGMPWPTR